MSRGEGVALGHGSGTTELPNPFAPSTQDPARKAPAGPRKVPAFLDAHVRESEVVGPTEVP